MAFRSFFLVTAVILPSAAFAEMPVFSAQCLENYVDADSTGTVRINGAVMDVERFNEHYYQARMESLIISISHEGGGRDLIVNFTGPGGSNGVCTVLGVQSAEAPMEPMAPEGGAGGPDHFTVSVDTRLKVHSQPSTLSPTVGILPNGAVVENRGCRQSDGRSWCHISDGDVSGWAASEFLVEGTGPVRSARATPVHAGKDAGHTAERVRFPRGSSGTEFTDSLDAGKSHRFVVGASNGQDLYVRIDAGGPGLSYRILNPNHTALVDEIRADMEYRGQLWQSGDHVIEVFNRSGSTMTYDVIIGVE
ncbi:SH3 domain-containing protein [Albidovulum sediminis]|uniref:SH3 domain-containing protein n=1 Tax=Albidovulum sediminis TaxID=3066345 RepID=A0ABT2NKB9_9RHOB|nr:SH3 domain-containing protein [Defluviimonas sediminis]MCT8329362.1 SH3 domain-containing protein [Defluviimonas sediminis]